MKIEIIEEYTKHGCNIGPFSDGLLVLINYSKEFQNHPRYGEWGAMVYSDGAVKAKALLEEVYDEYDVLLAIPDFVARVYDKEEE